MAAGCFVVVSNAFWTMLRQQEEHRKRQEERRQEEERKENVHDSEKDDRY